MVGEDPGSWVLLSSHCRFLCFYFLLFQSFGYRSVWLFWEAVWPCWLCSCRWRGLRTCSQFHLPILQMKERRQRIWVWDSGVLETGACGSATPAPSRAADGHCGSGGGLCLSS